MKNFSLELPIVASLSKGERYVVLARLTDYFRFIVDDGALRRYLFDSNVRDFVGLTGVNEGIRNTLANQQSPDFWWLNNGVTILASRATIVGSSIHANDIQIVNGLQTTESIFRHFTQPDVPATDDRCVLVKVIVTKDKEVADEIIRATNTQTIVETSSLHATDKIQRDIEEVLLRSELYYERRKNFYTNQARTPAELVTPMFAAASNVALVLKAPHIASRLRPKFMLNTASYSAVFDTKLPLAVWPKIVGVLKRVDTLLRESQSPSKRASKVLNRLRYVLAFLVVSRQCGRFSYSAVDLVDFDIANIDAKNVADAQATLYDLFGNSPDVSTFDKFQTACVAYARAFGIADIEAVRPYALSSVAEAERSRKARSTTPEFVEKVRLLLPPQPWKPGVHRPIIAQLNCTTAAYGAAIDQLIEDGHCLNQQDGVLYDREGNVVAFDFDRVDPVTLQLRTTEESPSSER